MLRLVALAALMGALAAVNQDDVMAYRPDVAIDRPTEMTIGGTPFSLLPTRGGETDDALLMHLPDQGVLFAGDQVIALKPRLLLHGHEPLTRIFDSTTTLAGLRPQLE